MNESGQNERKECLDKATDCLSEGSYIGDLRCERLLAELLAILIMAVPVFSPFASIGFLTD